MIEITYYTDPLCCWSWGFEPQWRRLQAEFRGQITWTYKMGGLLPSWTAFHDADNHVSRPIQMGPVWMHAAQITGMPMSSRLWMEDPPASSYPACVAVKCAELQSASTGDAYLRRLREGVMLQGKNIARQAVLLEIAEKLAGQLPQQFDYDRFCADLQNEAGLEAFRADIALVQRYQINRFPTLIWKNGANNAIKTTGYRPYQQVLEALQTVAPGIVPSYPAPALSEYEQEIATVTEREKMEWAGELQP